MLSSLGFKPLQQEGDHIDVIQWRKASMKRLLHLVRSISAIQKGYFSECSREIAVRNLHLMRTAGFAGIILYVVYFVITFIFFSDKSISPYYGLIVPVLACFSINHAYAQRENLNTRHPSGFPAALHHFDAQSSSFSRVPAPEVPSVYYPSYLSWAGVVHIALLPQLILTFQPWRCFFRWCSP
jgi:hypothetical protein